MSQEYGESLASKWREYRKSTPRMSEGYRENVERVPLDNLAMMAADIVEVVAATR